MKPPKPPAPKRMKVYADIGSHGGVFMFGAGDIANRYPNLLQIYACPDPSLTPMMLVPIPARKNRRGRLRKP